MKLSLELKILLLTVPHLVETPNAVTLLFIQGRKPQE